MKRLISKKVLLGAALVAALALGSHSASAGLVGVDEIWVYSALPPFTAEVQIAELIATQTGTGTDVALATNGASATATSSFVLTAPGNAIDGFYPAGYPAIWHSAGSAPTEHLVVQLAGPRELDSVTIYGRLDCCQERDFYNVQFYNSADVLLYTGQVDARGGNGFGTLALPNAAAAAVPEPATLALLALGLAGFGFSRRRKSN